MPLPSPGRPVSPEAPAELVADMARSGLSSADVRRRLHTLFPDQPPSFWFPWLRRGAFGEPVGRRSAPHGERQLRLGVEVVAAVAEGLPLHPRAALHLSAEDIDTLEDLIGEYDPSGAIIANSIMMVGALRERIRAGERPVLLPSAYQELLLDIQLVADVPDTHRLRWPAAPSVVARLLGDGDWSRAMSRIGLDGGPASSTEPETAPVAREVQELGDPGIGLFAAPADPQQGLDHAWDELRDRLVDELRSMAWKDVLVLRYTPVPDHEAPPSTWARTGPEGATVSISGVNDGRSALWPWEDAYFQGARWHERSDHQVAWSSGPMPHAEAAELMIEGMRFGRLCTDPYRFCWGVGDAAAGTGEDAPSPGDDTASDESDGSVGTDGGQQRGPVASVLPFPGHPS